jgi:hypothetical protein
MLIVLDVPERQAMHQVTCTVWKNALKDAIEETDPRLARTKLARAEFAVFNRMHGFVSSANPSEVQALFEALETIQVLRLNC